jgi:hypothetical protein
MDFKSILQGWANLTLDQIGALDPIIKKKAEERLRLCNICSIREKNICSSDKHGINIKTQKLTQGCGCVIPAKTMALESNCPLDKW